MKDYYSILGINKSASDADIKHAYRKLASKHHPDRGGNADKFKEIQEAYDILGDKQKRSMYDSPQGFFTQKNNFDDIVDQYFTQFDLRSRMRNSRISLWITLQEVALGGPRMLSININNSTVPVQIDIPQGVQDGEAIRYPKLLPGNVDLVVEFRIKKDADWRREGLDLWCNKKLNFWQLIQGCEVNIRDISNKTYTLKVPARTKPGSVLRLPGKGLQRDRHNPGDIFVKTEAVMPDNIPQELIDILNKIDINK